ncbi:unnamed protein product [Arctogadus glacialis]
MSGPPSQLYQNEVSIHVVIRYPKGQVAPLFKQRISKQVHKNQFGQNSRNNCTIPEPPGSLRETGLRLAARLVQPEEQDFDWLLVWSNQRNRTSTGCSSGPTRGTGLRLAARLVQPEEQDFDWLLVWSNQRNRSSVLRSG